MVEGQHLSMAFGSWVGSTFMSMMLNAGETDLKGKNALLEFKRLGALRRL